LGLEIVNGRYTPPGETEVMKILVPASQNQPLLWKKLVRRLETK
jgi:hypothetical protein